jgi:predicted transcriptional regulator
MDEYEISKIFSRPCVRMVKYLYSNDYATKRVLKAVLRTSDQSVKTCIELLSKYGIIKVSKVGRAYVIMLNREGKTTKAVIGFLREVGYL